MNMFQKLNDTTAQPKSVSMETTPCFPSNICLLYFIEIVYKAVFWRNMFALEGGVSKTQSPSETVFNRKLNYNAHCKVKIGEHVQTHEEHSNGMTSYTLGAITTRPSNDADSCYLISL